jgi:glycosyltransferase involved in cell wall biosynthesis
MTAGLQNRRLAVYVPRLFLGGGELSMLRLAGALARQGHSQAGAGQLSVDLVVHSLAGAEMAPPAGVRVVELGSGGSLGSVRHLARWLRQARPRWLLSAFPHTNVSAVAAARLAGSGCLNIVSEHAPLSLQIQRQGTLRYRALPPLVRWAYPRAAAVVAVSAGVREDLLRLCGPALKLHTIANPVLDADADAPATEAEARARARSVTPLHPWLADAQLRVVLGVSRLSAEKDIPTLLRAFALLHAQHPHTRLLLAGEGPARAGLEALVAELGLGAVVALPGRIQGPRHWMAHAAVFALASQYEGFGNVLIEALASGCPVVSTDCPVGPREILEGGRFGRLVAVGDAAAMAAALQGSIDQPGLPPGALAHALQFTDAAACSAYLRLLDSLAPTAATQPASTPMQGPAC